MSASYESYGTPDAVQFWSETCATASEDLEFVEHMASRGLADPEILAQYAMAWREWAQHPGAFHARPWCEAVSWVIT